IFPLIGAPGGVRERAAAAEAAIELCSLAGAGDMAVICSIMRDDGEMARIDDLDAFIARHRMPVADIDVLLDRLR
ncbi:3,4-dihydroxy-2-butanone-4-phosphate synthase, partial [Paenibacillus elgii]|nr:3,4-dihydroxy-2-butanone-4-phosphate synthase [Paenibacillus elgii]